MLQTILPNYQQHLHGKTQKCRLQTLLEKLPPSPALQQLKTFVEEERALLAAPRLHRAP